MIMSLTEDVRACLSVTLAAQSTGKEITQQKSALLS
jgi:hypothetical protein